MSAHNQVTWVLRLAVAGEFFGHGCWAVMQNPSWIPFITLFGWSFEAAQSLLSLVGWLDISLAVWVLISPHPWALTWMTFWGTFTALLRPLSGGAWLDFIERAPNFGAPLALLLLTRHAQANQPPAPFPQS